DGRGEAVDGVVRQLDGLRRRAEGHRREYGPEDLLLRNRRRGADSGEQRRRKVKAASGKAIVGLIAGRAFCNALRDVGLDAIELDGIDDRANVHSLIEWRADAQRFHARADLAIERLGDALLHQQSRAGTADLALVEPDAIDETFDSGVEVGIVEDDVRRLAAEFERELLGRGCRRLADDAADLG